MYQLDWTFNFLPLEAPYTQPFVEAIAGGPTHVSIDIGAAGSTGIATARGPVVSGAADAEPLFLLGEHAPMWLLAATGSWRANV